MRTPVGKQRWSIYLGILRAKKTQAQYDDITMQFCASATIVSNCYRNWSEGY